jgi:glycosyltransferase involved in cell wall biosynthesis
MSAPLRVLLVSLVPDNRHSGMGKWTHEIADALRERGHRVTTWFEDRFPSMRTAGRWSVLLFPMVLARAVWAGRREFDALVVHEPSAAWLGLMRRAGAPIPPVLAMSHGIESRAFRDLLAAARRGFAVVPRGTRIKTPLLRLPQSDAGLRLADAVLCLSTLDRDHAIRALGCDPGRVHAFVNGVGSRFYAPPRAAAPGRRKVVFLGGWTDDRKGRRIVPRTWGTVRRRVPGATLTLLGTGVAADAVLAHFDETDRESVAVVPRLEDPGRVADALRDHDVFFLPTLAEGSPLALLEAMAAGLAPVASRVGGIPDIVTDGTDGLLFAAMDVDGAADALARALGDEELRRRLADGASRRARQLTWQAAAAEVERAVLATVAAVPARAAGV